MKTHIKIIYSATSEGFEVQVNGMLAKGWMLHGPTQVDTQGRSGYYQAMTFDPESEPGYILGQEQKRELNPSF